MDVKMLFNVNPNKFKEVAKDKTYEQFIKYLKEQPNFQIINLMNENDRKQLYLLAKM